MGTLYRNVAKISLLAFLSLALIITLMPANALAGTTWGEGGSDEEQASEVIVNYEGSDRKDPDKINWLQYKKGDFGKDKYTFVNIDDELNLDPDKGLTGDHKLTVIKNQMTAWSKIASKIFKSGATTGGSSTDNSPYGVTSNTLLHDWSYYFEYTGSDGRAHGRINLPDWLLHFDSAKRDTYSSWPAEWTWKTTGVKHANSLAEVRDEMVKTIASEYNIPADAVYKQRKNGENDRGVLSQINDSKNRNDGVYYTIVCHHTDESLLFETAYNCYAVILYDMCTYSLGGDGLYYPLQNEHYTENPNSDAKIIAMKNESDDAGTGTITYTSGYEETSSYQHQYSHAFNPGISAGGQIAVGTSDLLPVKITGTFKLDGHFDYTYQDTGVDTKGKTDNHTESASLSSDLAPHTGKNYSNYQAVQANTVNYMDPSYLSYNIAICSISGTKAHGSNYIYNPADFCTFFAPTSSPDSGINAITNLYTRRNSESLGESYGKTEGYINGKLSMEELNWESKSLSSDSLVIGGEPDSITRILKSRESDIPFISKGLTLNLNNANYLLSSGKTMPLYPLTTVKVADKLLSSDNKIINMAKGESYSLDGIDVEGYDGGKAEDGSAVNPINYHGFDSSDGYWAVATKDKNGNPLPGDVISIDTDPLSGRQVLKVNDKCNPTPDEPKKGYIEWHISNGKKYETLTGEVVTDATLKNRPYVEVVCHSPFEGYNIMFKNTEAEGYAKELIPLSTLLPVDVLKPDGTPGSNNVTYKLRDTVDSNEALIVDGKFLNVKKDIDAGLKYKEYEVYATYGELSSLGRENGVAKVRVYPAKKLTLQPYQETRTVNPAMEVHNLGTAFDLSVHLGDYKDQYGNPWEGDVPEWKFEIAEGAANASIREMTIGGETRSFLVARKAGNYKVNVIPKSGSSSDVMATYTYKVQINPKQAKTPSAKTGLVYNGNEQVAVEGGVGYDVINGSAVDSGMHRATAILEEGFAWADGHMSRQREIPYSIAPKSVAVPSPETDLVFNGDVQVGVMPGEGYTLTDNSRAKDAGTYEVIATPAKNYVWSDGTSQSVSITYTIDKAKVKVPTATQTFDYDGSVHTALPAGEGYTVTGGSETNAGSYVATATLADKSNYTWEDGTTEDLNCDYVIRKAKVLNPIPVTAFTYDGTTHVAMTEGDGYTVTGGSAINAGRYTAGAALRDKSNYEWMSGGSMDIIADYNISKAVVKAPDADTDFVYNGKRQVAVPEGSGYTVTGGSAKNAGDYTATVRLDDSANYQWSTGGSKDLTFGYTIEKATIPFPKTNVKLVYNGKMQTAVQSGSGYNVLNGQAKKAGDYAATVELNDSVNYKWNNGGSARQQVIYAIERAKVSDPKVRSGLVYNGKKQTGVAIADGYLVTNGAATKAGSYTATAKLKDSVNYAWTSGGSLDRKLDYTIAKAKNTLKVKGKTISVKYKKLKKKNQSFSRSKAVAVKKSVGKLSYKKVSGNKKITINKKSGKITVKKKLKKGTYKIKMKVKAAGNSNYKALTKTVTFKVKVK